jgi:lipopolysaccharide transport system ATP-binding protein
MNKNSNDITLEDSNYAIVVKNLSKRFSVNPAMFMVKSLAGKIQQKESDFQALNNVSFSIKKGEAVGILGENGSGKSTLLQIIANILKPSSGSVKTNGKLAALLELGSGFNPDFTGRENVYLNACILGLTKKQTDKVFEGIEEFADIGEFIDLPISTYSSGMKMRLAFAVQVFVEPEILIVDEALGVGDQFFRKKCLEKIYELLSKSITFILVSHSEEMLRQMTQRLLLIHKGELISDGKTVEVIDQYDKIMGMPIRRFDGQIIDRNDIKQKHNSSSENLCSSLVKVLNVCVQDKDRNERSTYYPGEELIIRIKTQNFSQIPSLSLGIRIRNRDGLKVYSWSTKSDNSFLHEIYSTVEVKLTCNLGLGIYSIDTVIVQHNECINDFNGFLDWVRDATFFRIELTSEKIFGGVCYLNAQSKIL